MNEIIDLMVAGWDIVKFSIDIEDYTSTLLKFDVVNLEGAVQDELIEMIKNEDIVICKKYDKWV